MKKSQPIIDCHVNLTPDGGWFATGHKADLGRLLGEMDQAGVAGALLVALPGAAENSYIAEICARYPEKFRGLGHVKDWSNPEAEIAIIRSMGLSGVKAHPRMQNLDVLDPALDRAWRVISEAGLPLLLDGYFQNHADGLSLEKFTPFYYDRLARRHPELCIILAHAGAQRVLDAMWVARSNPNFYLDISHVLAYYSGTSLISDIAMVMDMCDKKVLYGSDFPEYGIGEYLDIFYKTARTRPGMDVRAVLCGNLKKIIDFGC